MTTQTQGAPAGFVPVQDTVEETVNYPVVKPENFAGKGRVVVYHGSKVVGEDKNTMHIVAPQDRPEAKFILWGSAMLNRKLRTAGAGEVLHLQYCGKEPHPSSENGQHVWVVGRQEGSSPTATVGRAPRPAAVENWDEK